MPLDGSPKKVAQDIASGLFSINRSTLKHHNVVDIRKIVSGLMIFSKEIRTQTIDSGDYAALKAKGLKMQRINGALSAIRAWAKENKQSVGI